MDSRFRIDALLKKYCNYKTFLIFRCAGFCFILLFYLHFTASHSAISHALGFTTLKFYLSDPVAHLNRGHIRVKDVKDIRKINSSPV
jgi:hypothetical protein